MNVRGSLSFVDGIDEAIIMALIGGAASAAIISELLIEIILVFRDAGTEADATRMGTLLASALLKMPNDDEEIIEAFGLALIEFLDCFFGNSLRLLGGALWREGLFGRFSSPSLRIVDASLRLWERLGDEAKDIALSNSTPSSNVAHHFGNKDTSTISSASFSHGAGIDIPEIIVCGFSWVVKVLQWPTGAMTRQEVDDFRSFRHIVGDGLKDLIVAALAFGVDLSMLLTFREEKMNDQVPNARFAEAVLTAARLVAGTIPDTADEPIGSLMQQLSRLLATYSRDPRNERLWYGALLFISAYGPWTSLVIQRAVHFGPFQLETILSVLSVEDTAPWASLSFAAAAMALETLLASGIGIAGVGGSDVERLVSSICTLFRRHPRNERILGALTHLLVGAKLASMLQELVASLWGICEFRSLELVLSISAERASENHHSLVPVLRELAPLLGNWPFESLNAGLLRSILLIALLLPESDEQLLNRLSMAILNLCTRAIENEKMQQHNKTSLHKGSTENAASYIRLASNLLLLMVDSFIRRVAAARGVQYPTLVAFVTGILGNFWLLSISSPNYMDAMVVLLRSVMELLPECVIIMENSKITVAIITWIATWMEGGQAFDPDLVFECCQLLSDIYFAAMDEEVPKAHRQSLLLALQGGGGGSPSIALIRAIVKVVICSTIFPHDMIPEISRLILLVCDVLGQTSTGDGSSAAEQTSTAATTLAGLSVLRGALEAAVHSLPEAHFSNVEVAVLMESIPELITTVADKSLTPSKRASKLIAYCRSIHRTCRRRLADDGDGVDSYD